MVEDSVENGVIVEVFRGIEPKMKPLLSSITAAVSVDVCIDCVRFSRFWPVESSSPLPILACGIQQSATGRELTRFWPVESILYEINGGAAICEAARGMAEEGSKCIVEEEPEAAFGYGTAKSAWSLFRKTDRST